MPDVIQFNCPACDVALTLPLAMAAAEGPCPRCAREIIAPDPAHGLDAREATAPAVPEQAQSRTETKDSRKAASQTPAFVLTVILTATLFLIVGFMLGARSGKTPAHVSSPAPPLPTVIQAPDEAPRPPPAAVEPEKTIEPVKASDAAEAALKAFLDAPDWTARSAHTLHSEKLADAMESYSRETPDGPTPYSSVSIQNSYTDKITGNTLFIYQVVTGQHPDGFPVAVSETPGGWLVDWQAFVEFRDDRFVKFADGPAGQSGRFHLLVTAPPAERAENTENAHFSSFVVEAPMPDRQRLAYVSKSSKIHASLTAATANGAIFTPVLEVTKRKAPDDRTYLEITDIHATDWLPESWR